MRPFENVLLTSLLQMRETNRGHYMNWDNIQRSFMSANIANMA